MLRSIVAPALLVLLSSGAWTPAVAKEFEFREPTPRDLAALKAMRYAGPVPDLGGFSAAPAYKAEGLQGGKDYSAAYRSKEGCVLFFAPLGKGEHDLAIKWQGPKCDGKPLHGEGTLSVSLQIDRPEGAQVAVFVSRGRFQNGMLTGEGEKTNFSFGPDGQRNESIFAFSGSFANGLLDGLGKRTWTGPASGQPSAQTQEGQFTAGTPHGEILFSQLRPQPRVEAETKTLEFDDNGRPLLEQQGSVGAIFFYGDPAGWVTKVETLNKDWSMRRALLYRGRSAHGDLKESAGCLAWEFHEDGLHCTEGALTWRRGDSTFALKLEGKPFQILRPPEGAGPFRVRDQELLRLGGSPGEEAGLTSSADLTSCRGAAILPLTTWVYFSGQVEYERGEVRPVSGVFRQSPSSSTRTPGQDERVAGCRDFRSPTRCRSGWSKRGEATDDPVWTGRFELRGVEFDPRRGYDVSGPDWGITMEGEGRLLYESSGRWADLRAEEDRFLSIGRCGDDDSDDLNCRLEGQTVVFPR